MPIYAYSCQACHHELDALHKVSDSELTLCPQCGEERLVKELSAPSFHLSGSGWFRDEKTIPKKVDVPKPESPTPASTPEAAVNTAEPAKPVVKSEI